MNRTILGTTFFSGAGWLLLLFGLWLPAVGCFCAAAMLQVLSDSQPDPNEVEV